MFIIASEQTRELDRLRKLLDTLGQPYRVFVTNLETDIAEQTEKSGDLFYQKTRHQKLGTLYFSMI
ncbi:MAG: hypothetical protein ACLVJN_05065 [Streptococcus parasanguinis]